MICKDCSKSYYQRLISLKMLLIAVKNQRNHLKTVQHPHLSSKDLCWLVTSYLLYVNISTREVVKISTI